MDRHRRAVSFVLFAQAEAWSLLEQERFRARHGRDGGVDTRREPPVVARAVVVVCAAAAMMVAVADPGAACEPGRRNTIRFDDVVDLDPSYRPAGYTDTETVAVSPVGVVEWQVVAHAPGFPILSSPRRVTVRSRTWGEVPDFAARDSRHGGGYFPDLPYLFGWCADPPVEHITGDVGLEVYANRDDGTLMAFAMKSDSSFSPDGVTFPGGLAPRQVDALSARFGPPDHIDGQPRLSARVGWWLSVWQAWLIVAGGVGLLVILRVRRRRRAQIRTADTGQPP